MKIETKKKIGKFIIAMTVITSSASTGGYFNKAQANTKEKEIKIIVAKGDNLWNLSKTIAEEHGIKDDVREIVYNIQKQNNLFGKHIKENQTLVVTIK